MPRLNVGRQELLERRGFMMGLITICGCFFRMWFRMVDVVRTLYESPFSQSWQMVLRPLTGSSVSRKYFHTSAFCQGSLCVKLLFAELLSGATSPAASSSRGGDGVMLCSDVRAALRDALIVSLLMSPVVAIGEPSGFVAITVASLGDSDDVSSPESSAAGIGAMLMGVLVGDTAIFGSKLLSLLALLSSTSSSLKSKNDAKSSTERFQRL